MVDNNNRILTKIVAAAKKTQLWKTPYTLRTSNTGYWLPVFDQN